MLFQIGDIVEAHFSFVVTPVKNNKFQMFLVLRGLGLLDGSFSSVCYLILQLCICHSCIYFCYCVHKQCQAAQSKCLSNISSSSTQDNIFVLKCKTCYDEDEEADMRHVRRAIDSMSV